MTHDSYTILTLIEHDMHVCPIEQFSAQSYNSSLRTTRAGFRNEDAVNDSAPYRELQDLILTGGHKN